MEPFESHRPEPCPPPRKTQYLLYTNVISDFVKGHPAALPKLKQTPPRLVGISSITLMEIEFGLQLENWRVSA